MAVYACDTVKFGEQFELNGGLRYENNKGSFRSENLTSGVTQSGDNDEHLFSYRAGAAVKQIPASSIHVSYANSDTLALATVRLGQHGRASCRDRVPVLGYLPARPGQIKKKKQ